MGIFGSTTSEDVVCDMVNSGIAVVNSSNTICSTKLSQTEAINIEGCDNFTAQDLDFTQLSSVDSSCVATNAASTDVSASVEQAICQTAATTKDTFMPQLDDTSSETYQGLVTDLSISVTNAFSEDCSQDIAQDESINCKDSSGVSLQRIKFSDYTKGTQSCIANNVMSSSAASALSNFLTQHSDTLNTDPLADLVNGIVSSPLILLAIVGVVVLLIIVPLFGGEEIVMTAFKSPMFWIAVIILVIFLVVFFTMIRPSSSSSSNDDDDDNDDGT